MIKKDMYNLTNPQKNIKNIEQFYKGTSINNVCGSAVIDDKLNLEILKQAIDIVIKNNTIFLMQFTFEEGILKQYVSNEIPPEPTIVNVDNTLQMEEFIAKKLINPFKITDSFLFQFYIFNINDEKTAFTLNIHHLISDSWTLGFICKEIINTYSLLISDSFINASTPSYIEYINSENSYIESEKFKKDRAYWNEKFAVLPEAVKLPRDQHLEEVFEDIPIAKRKSFVLSNSTISMIDDFCKNYKVSKYNFFMAIYGLYIGKICNLDDFSIGTPILNRTNFNEKHTAGMFVSTVPFRFAFKPSQDFLSFLGDIAIDSISMLRHQKYPYSNLLEDLRKQNGTVPNLYNVLLSYQITNAQNNAGNLNYTTSWSFNGYCSDPLNIHISDLNDLGSLDISYDYQINTYTEEYIINLHNRILNIIAQVLDNPKILLSDVALITKSERTEILQNFNDTKILYDENIPFIHYFEEQAKKTPHNSALVFENKTMDYKTLNENANSLAYVLRNAGITNNSILGILAERSFEMIIAMLAVLKSGGAYIPIDPDYPADRISYMLENSKSTLLLKKGEFSGDINFSGKILDISLENIEIYNSPCNNLPNISAPSDLSYIIYTSGSTGLPKGVMLTQKSLSNFYIAMNSYVDYLKLGNKISMASITTFSFDIFIFETLISLSNGLKVYITNYIEQKVTEKLESLIYKENITAIQTTPSVMQFHIDNLKDTKHFSGLKYVTLAGEQLSKNLVDKIKKIAPDVKIYNGYGPSETTVFSTMYDITCLNKITIGKPIGNTDIYILNNDLALLPKGVPGEIYIAGDGVGRGYLYRNDLTCASYLKNPFIPNSIMYKSGDIGIWNEDGTIECRGRIDHQIKLHGLRVELGEIEEKISTYGKLENLIGSAIVKTINDKQYIVAFLQCSKKINIKELKTYLLTVLPNYMVPTYFTQVEKLPRTPNGKIDKKALRTFDININENREFIKPKTPTELKLFALVSEILKSKNFSMDSDIFSIGFDSLSVILLISKILKEFEVELSIKQVYNSSSLSCLASLIDSSSKTTVLKISKATVNNSYPLSEEQSSIFYACNMLSPESTLLYNVSGGVLIDTVLELDKINKTFNKLVDRHGSLRTYFKIMDNKPRQVVLPYVNLTTSYSADTEKNLTTLINNFPKPFDLSTAPLFRVEAIILDNKKTLILIDSHHIVLDGSSLELLVNEFCKLYEGKKLAENTIDYIDFTMWEQNYINSPIELEKCEKYWLDKFQGRELPSLNLPYDAIPTGVTFEGNTLLHKIPKHTFEKIENLAKTYNVSTYTIFLAVFYLLLYRYTSQDEILIGIPIANRYDISLNNVIGMFVNNAVLDVVINPDITFNKFINVIKDVVVDAINNQPYPYHLLNKRLNLNGKNLFDVMFIYQNERTSTTNVKNANVHTIPAITNTSKFNFSMEIYPDSLDINLEYNTQMFKKFTAQSILEHYIDLLNNISEIFENKLSDIQILLAHEKAKIINDFNSSYLEYDKNKDILAMFEEKAKMYPRHVAVIFENNTLSYKELNKNANQLANFLWLSGITNDDTIAIRLSRSFDLIIAILAVIKSGATYLLIDPSLPNDRINYMLENSSSKLLITNSSLGNCNFASTLNLDEFKFSKYHSRNLQNVDRSENLSIIYTSGSTGNPKGVLLTKKGFTNLMYAFDKDMEISKYNRILGIATVSFDMFTVELFAALTFGNTLILANKEQQKNVIAIANLIKDYNVEFFVTTPSRVELLLLDECENPLENVKCFQLGGEKFTPLLYEKLKKCTNAKIYNGYGPTEISACCSNKCLTDENINIGKPLPNMKIYIFDSYMNLCPIGVVGEICVAGYGVSNGYIGNTIATNKSFIPNPLNTSEILYKTGDLGKYNENGEIEYIGRSDFQIKIRGLRIELSEIEAKLNELDMIDKSCVLYVSNVKSPYLIGFVTAKDDINVHIIKTALSKTLPTYMVPRYIVQIDQFPITLNGKIDRNALKKYQPSININNESEYTPPENDMQKLFCDIWSELLSTQVGIDDDLFDIGADSLLAMRFKTQLLSYDIDLPYSDIFKYKTIRGLCNINLDDTGNKNSLNDFDYTNINDLLSSQNTNLFTSNNTKNVLLLGGTGFIGMHIIYSFIKNCTGKIYCIVREKNKLSAKARFMNLLHFYFGDELDQFVDDRIIILKGSIVKENFGLSNVSYSMLSENVDVLINSAANVKHFGNADKFKTINTDSLNILINFCLKFNKRLIHISSLSISGNMILDGYKASNEAIFKQTFTEKDLFVGQTLDNVYSRSKFEAERLILDNIVSNNLDAQILRLGNITSRFSDGKFQINCSDNAFANRIKSFLDLKVLPEYLLNDYVEFTPVDYCADAIISVLNNKYDNMYIYHIYNDNHVYFSKLVKLLQKLNLKVKIVSEEKFEREIDNILSNKDTFAILSGIINDLGANKKISYASNITIISETTKSCLKANNFTWPKIDLIYLDKYLKYLKEIKFLN